MLTVDYTACCCCISPPQDFTARFDALLVAPEEAVRRIRGAVTMALNSSGSNETSPEHDWRGWGREDDEAIAVAVEEALRHAGDSVYDEIGEEIVAAAARGDEPIY